MWVRLPPRAPLFTNTYGDLSRAACDPSRRPFTLALPAAWLTLLRCIVCRAAKGASQPRKIPLDRLCMVCYYTCQVRVRTFFDCGSFSAAFPFFGAENVGQIPLESTLTENKGRGTQLLLTRNPVESVSPDAPTITDHHRNCGGLGQHFEWTATHPIRTGEKLLRLAATSPTILREANNMSSGRVPRRNS